MTSKGFRACLYSVLDPKSLNVLELQAFVFVPYFYYPGPQYVEICVGATGYPHSPGRLRPHLRTNIKP